MDVAELVLRDGDRVRATGRVIQDGSGDWFEPDLPVAEPGGRERRVRPGWRGGAVPVAGADLDAVSDRFERDGAVTGRAELLAYAGSR